MTQGMAGQLSTAQNFEAGAKCCWLWPEQLIYPKTDVQFHVNQEGFNKILHQDLGKQKINVKFVPQSHR